jgi:DNA-binding CsgD family transcriptional regulator
MKHPDDGSPGQIPRNIEFRLNDRDFDILRLVEEGKSNNEIAEKLGYSEATVRADLTRLFKMTNAKGRREVTRLARELGLYDG